MLSAFLGIRGFSDERELVRDVRLRNTLRGTVSRILRMQLRCDQAILA